MSNSQKRYGAVPEEWRRLMESNLIPNVLPIVSNPELKSSPALAKSNTRGKVPSLKNNGIVVGFVRWTAHVSTAEEVKQWSLDPDNGFCVRTGLNGIIALDCDCDTAATAEGIRDLFSAKVQRDDVPMRTRGGTRWATLIRVPDLPDNFRKTVIKTGNDDKLEVLADGQQLACCGTHPKGTRYSWSGNPFMDVPEVSYADLNDFLAQVSMIYSDGEQDVITGRAREKGQTYDAPDRVADFLAMNALVLSYGRNREMYIDCPWKDQHTGDSGEQQTVYFPAGSNGYPHGGFKCLHAHCAGRTTADFRQYLVDMYGYEETDADQYPDESAGQTAGNGIDYSDLTAEDLKKAQLRICGDAMRVISSDEEEVRSMDIPREEKANIVKLMDPEYFSENTGRLKCTANAISFVIDSPIFFGYEFAYDTFTNQIMFRRTRKENVFPWVIERGQWEPYLDDRHTIKMIRRLETIGFSGGGIKSALVLAAITAYAHEHAFNSLKLYLDSNMPKWDGVSRAEGFFINYCHAEDTAFNRAAGRYLFAMLYARATSDTPIKADISIILVGPQGARKSTCAQILALDENWSVGISMRMENKEIAQRIQGKTVIEVGEMAGMSKKDVDELKDFLTLKTDQWRPPYSKNQITATRHCIFIMTTNQNEFLTDVTGNRRYAIVDVDHIDTDAVKRDVLMLWAEGAEIYKAEGGEKLHREIEQNQDIVGENYMLADPWIEDVSEWLKTQEVLPEEERYQLNSRNILKYALNFHTPTIEHKHTKRVAGIMQKLGYVNKTLKKKGKVCRSWIKGSED